MELMLGIGLLLAAALMKPRPPEPDPRKTLPPDQLSSGTGSGSGGAGGKTPSPDSPTTPPADGEDLNGLVRLAGSVPVVGLWAAAGTAAAYGGGQLTQAITGRRGSGTVEVAIDLFAGKPVDLSKVDAVTFLGETTAAFGFAYAGGTQVGRGINEAFGGSGDVVGTQLAESLAGPWGLFMFIDPIESTGIALTSAIIYSVYSTISDVERLAFGQRRARSDFELSWERAETIMRGLFPQKPVPVRDAAGNVVRIDRATWAHPDEVTRYLTPMADGFMRHKNRLAMREYMTRPHGIGMDDVAHAQYGWLRGYFVGRRTGLGTLAEEPSFHCYSDEYRQLLQDWPAGAVRTLTYERIANYRWKLVPNTEPTYDALGGFGVRQPPSWVTPEMLEQSEAQLKASNPSWSLGGVLSAPPAQLTNPRDGTRINVRDYWAPTYVPVTEIVTGTSDALVESFVQLGEYVANVFAWVGWLNEPAGAFVNPFKHAQAGRKQDRFDGQPESDGLGHVSGLRYQDRLISKDGKLIVEPT